MVTRSGVGRTCTTARPAGSRGKTRLDKRGFRSGLCSSHVRNLTRNSHPAAREVRENPTYSWTQPARAVPEQPAPVHEPAEAALHHPTAFEHDEALLGGIALDHA